MLDLTKKVIICDLDGTLAESKSAVSKEMVEVLCKILHRYFLVVVSGGAFHQFQKQFLSNFSCSSEVLTNLILFPASGSTCYRYVDNQWQQLYNEQLTEQEREKIKEAFKEAILRLKLDLSPN